MNIRRFRTAAIVLTLLVLFAGPALAQLPAPLTCNQALTVTPTIRAEGFSEQIGDILVTCVSGVPPLPAGTGIPQVNLSISLNVPITSRLLDPATGATEALLLVNEPGSPYWVSAVNGYGSTAPQILCPTPTTGCAEYMGYLAGVY